MKSIDEPHRVFKTAIACDPENTTLVLIYADWCDEQGDPRGELIRLLVEVRGSSGKHLKWKHFEHSVEAAFQTAELDSLIDQLNEAQQRLFACQCAESVMHLFENRFLFGAAPGEIIGIIRQYALRTTSRQDFETAGIRAARARRAVYLTARQPDATAADYYAVYAVSSVVAAAWGKHLDSYAPGYDIGPHAAVKYANQASQGEFHGRFLVWIVERLLGLKFKHPPSAGQSIP